MGSLSHKRNRERQAQEKESIQLVSSSPCLTLDDKWLATWASHCLSLEFAIARERRPMILREYLHLKCNPCHQVIKHRVALFQETRMRKEGAPKKRERERERERACHWNKSIHMGVHERSVEAFFCDTEEEEEEASGVWRSKNVPSKRKEKKGDWKERVAPVLSLSVQRQDKWARWVWVSWWKDRKKKSLPLLSFWKKKERQFSFVFTFRCLSLFHVTNNNEGLD